jgi:hypothetical protein
VVREDRGALRRRSDEEAVLLLVRAGNTDTFAAHSHGQVLSLREFFRNVPATAPFVTSK